MAIQLSIPSESGRSPLATTRRVLALVTVLALALAGCTSGESQAAAMADELGIPLMLPSGQKVGKPGTYGDNVLRLDGDPPGMLIYYEGFDVQLRPSDSLVPADGMDAFIALPEPPSDIDIEVVVDETRELTVLGAPAVAVTWHEDMGQKVNEPSHILVFQFEGAVARLSADLGSLDLDSLVDVAETFEPVAER